MALLTLRDIYDSVGEFPLFDHTEFKVEPKERIALIGRNGAGKSTLMKIMAKVITPQSGEIIKDSHINVAMLEQELPAGDDRTVYEAVAEGLQSLTDTLVEYHQLTTQESGHDDAWLNKLNRLQQHIEQKNGWDIAQRMDKALEELHLPADKKMKDLSGGWRRKVALARCFVQQPEVMLLDEPTNHLDLETIQWLEQRLLNYPHSIVFITHDRALLRKLATRIVELDRGKIVSYPPDYDEYLSRKQKNLEVEAREHELFDKKLADEEVWIRQGIKARRTRNEGRVRALEALREQRKQRQVVQKKANFVAHEVEKKGKTVIQAENVSFAYPNHPVFNDFTLTIQRGDKIAIIGPNGAGKTTLVKVLLAQLEPTTGTIKHSPTNQIAFFDQTRESLNLDQTLIDNVTEGEDFVEVQGKRKHIIGYLGEFLFSPKKCHNLVRTLSGGEQNRLMLAKLFSKPANVFVLDEPTNDLDVETLEVLETVLLNMKATVMVISHDREFIDNVATMTLAFSKENIGIHVGGYSDWLAYEQQVQSKPKPKTKTQVSAKPVKEVVKKTSPKLNYKQQQELKELPKKIDELEEQIKQYHAKMSQPDFFKQDQDKVVETQKQLAKLEQSLEQAFERWQELDT